jgi:two-component system LytT family response regulator
MMRAIVVDDEVHARADLEAALVRTGEVKVVASCANALEALPAIRRERPDLLFLDIQMPKVSGFELLSMIDPEIMPRVVFVTAYDQHALEAFEKEAVDYLLKPVAPERLASTLARLKRPPPGGPAPAAVAARPITRIPCLGKDSIRLVPVSEVEFVRCGPAGVYVVSARGELYTELTLQVLEARSELVRCHRQVLVNVQQVEEVLTRGPRHAAVRTRSGREVPVSRRHFAALKERLGLEAAEGDEPGDEG